MVQKTLDFVLAFPAIGKTTTAKALPGWIDLDFGHLREAFGVKKEAESQLLEAYAKLIRSYSDDGYIVLINEPKVLPYLKQKHMEGEVVLPDVYDRTDKVIAYNFAKAKEYALRPAIREPSDIYFAAEINKHLGEWIREWESLANRYGYPVHRVWYLDEYVHKNVNSLQATTQQKED